MSMKPILLLFLLFGAATAYSAAQETVDHETAINAARRWLRSGPGERRRMEARLRGFEGDIDAVIRALTPKGSAKHAEIKGREVKGDTFVVPWLLARNEDHPFNFYVPPHYDPAKPMGLILWMHGGGTYKPGKNVRRRSVEGKLKELNSCPSTYVVKCAKASLLRQ